jgi:hypothetical protein
LRRPTPEALTSSTILPLKGVLTPLSGFDSAEATTDRVPRRIAVFTAAEMTQVGRARGYEVEPIYSIEAHRFVDATEGKGLEEIEADMAGDAKSRSAAGPPCSRT